MMSFQKEATSADDDEPTTGSAVSVVDLDEQRAVVHVHLDHPTEGTVRPHDDGGVTIATGSSGVS
jgi:hypothetical protein